MMSSNEESFVILDNNGEVCSVCSKRVTYCVGNKIDYINQKIKKFKDLEKKRDEVRSLCETILKKNNERIKLRNYIHTVQIRNKIRSNLLKIKKNENFNNELFIRLLKEEHQLKYTQLSNLCLDKTKCIHLLNVRNEVMNLVIHHQEEIKYYRQIYLSQLITYIFPKSISEKVWDFVNNIINFDSDNIIEEGLNFLSQIVNMLAAHLGVILPKKLSYKKSYNMNFEKKKKNLNKNILHLCLSQNIKHTQLKPQSTLDNIRILIEKKIDLFSALIDAGVDDISDIESINFSDVEYDSQLEQSFSDSNSDDFEKVPYNYDLESMPYLEPSSSVSNLIPSAVANVSSLFNKLFE